ncbi:MAG: Holliday junction branch migration protein RuvA [Alphaproteobacteria bacterium]|nr:Holliday junction branch migration protein RuvA [Alphaproteobacteria bacterium]
MIGKLKGLIDEKGDGFIVLDVGGVGYHISCSARTLSNLPPQGNFVTIFTELLVGEMSLRLVGFISGTEREWFRLLNGVQGVGTRVALSILSVFSTSDLSRTVASGDKAFLARAQGVGPKVAQRIVSELKDKASALSVSLSGPVECPDAVSPPVEDVVTDAASALINLGYGQGEVLSALSRARENIDETPDVGTLIRLCLKDLSR